MPTERVTERNDGTTRERVVEHSEGGETYVDRGSGLGGLILGLAVLALVAIVAFFLLNQSRNDDLRTQAVTGAATTVSESATSAAKNVGDAATNVGDAASRAADQAPGAVERAPQ